MTLVEALNKPRRARRRPPLHDDTARICWLSVSSSRPWFRSRRRAQKLSRLAVVPTLRHTSALLGHTLTASSTMAPFGAVGMTIRGELAFGRGSIAPQPCIRQVQGPKP